MRELLAAARRRNTFRVRWWAAVIALGTTFLAVFFVSLAGRPGSAGKTVFLWVGNYVFGFSLIAGALLTADCISKEKREGTLGLLFLTELKGYDIVLGKFTALGLNAFYCVLALLPALALSFLLGGVTGPEFCRVAFAIANALFFSLAAGVLVSTCVRDSGSALIGTFALILVFVAAGFAPRLVLSFAWLQYLSPVAPMLFSGEGAAGAVSQVYWKALGASFAFAVLFILVASLQVPRVWQQKGHSRTEGMLRLLERGRRLTRNQRSQLLDHNPVLWLSREAGMLRWAAWAVVALTAALSLSMGGAARGTYLLRHGLTACGFVLKCLVAVHACRFFVEGRRSGTLELLLSTPLSQSEILRGHGLAFRRIFLGPLIAFVLVTLMPAVLHAVSRLGMTVSASLGFGFDFFMTLLASGSLAISMAADVVAVVWLGRWLALSSPRPHLALPLTILFVLILPSPFCGLYVLVDLALALYASAKLKGNFRLILARADSRSLQRH